MNSMRQMIDLHNHMLPRLDDGASDWDIALAMARLAVEDGIEGVVCTPHWVPGRFENGRRHVVNALEVLLEKLAAHRIPLQVFPGAELRLDFQLPEKIASGEVLTINDTGRYALIELPEEILPQRLEHFFWELQMKGVTPVIGHPERNHSLIQNPMRLYGWLDMGVITQITAASLLGKFGTEVQRFCVFLLKHHMVHVIGTDAHGLSLRTPKLSEAHEATEKLAGKEVARRLFYEHPKAIVQGKPFTPRDAVRPEPTASRLAAWKKKLLRWL